MSKSVVVLGGGISGLSVGWDLAKADHRVDIIEAQRVVGGLAGSFIDDGYVFDYGGHFFYTKYPDVFHRIKDLLKEDLLDLGEMYGDIKIIFRGKEYDYPLTIPSVLSNMELRLLARCLADYAKASVQRRFFPAPNVTFEDWVSSQFGRRLYEVFFGSFTEKTWGLSPTELAANFASERIPPLDIWKSIKDVLRKKTSHASQENATTDGYSPKHTYYPRKGCWQIPEAIKTEIESRGGTIHLESEVRKVVVENGRTTKVVYEKGGRLQELPADHVVATIPITALARVIEPLDPSTKEAGLGMRYRELTLVFLKVNRPRVLGARFAYFHDRDILFQRAGETRILSDDTVPSRDKTGLVLEVTNKDRLSDEEVYRQSVEGLEKLGLVARSEIEGHHIARQPHSYPIYDVNYQARLETFQRGISQIGGLVLCGRQALFRYIDMYQCMKMGMIVAKYVQGTASLSDVDGIVAQWSKA